MKDWIKGVADAVINTNTLIGLIILSQVWVWIETIYLMIKGRFLFEVVTDKIFDAIDRRRKK